LSPESTQASPFDWRTPHLKVSFRHTIGKLDMDIEFTLTQKWTVLFGPSGSGKTTILRAIAGLLRPRYCAITYIPQTIVPPRNAKGQPATLTDSAHGLWMPVYLRHMPMVPQSSTAFPHLTVRQNLQYPPLPLQGDSEEWRLHNEQVEITLRRFRIDHLANSFAAAISGGEARRVSLARASLAHTRYLLLDEPFAGLEGQLRDELITALREPLSPVPRPVLSVTHDVAEAFQLDAEVIKIADGKVTAQGPVETVLAEERLRLLHQLQS
jgi:molybdate transport system ATP-binding protein